MTLKKILLACLILTLILALLAGCGSKNESTPADKPEEAPAQQSETAETAEPAESTPAAEPEAEAETDAEPEAESVNPYAWLGLQDMPKCNYLDILSTNNFIQVYDTYVLGIKAEVTDACEGLKSYQKNQSNLSYNLEGMIYSLNTDAKQYMQIDMTSAIADAKAAMESAMAEGTNSKGRSFQGTGKSAVPLYADDSGDSAEYEYYEYKTGDSVLERFFMKDGDVFAVYTQTHAGDSELESTNVIKSISGDVPDDLFVLPDLSDYTKIS